MRMDHHRRRAPHHRLGPRNSRDAEMSLPVRFEWIYVGPSHHEEIRLLKNDVNLFIILQSEKPSGTIRTQTDQPDRNN